MYVKGVLQTTLDNRVGRAEEFEIIPGQEPVIVHVSIFRAAQKSIVVGIGRRERSLADIFFGLNIGHHLVHVMEHSPIVESPQRIQWIAFLVAVHGEAL